MLTPANALKGGKTYLGQHLCSNDYYCKDETVTGVWVGKGATLLGIGGAAIGPKDQAFEALRVNQHLFTGDKLTQRTREITYYEFQISAPKSVSIQAITAGDDRLVRAHEESWRAAFVEFERHAARRDREGDKANKEELRFTGNLAAAAFTHDTSRELEAQLHTHLVCANATYDNGTGKWFALLNVELYKAREVVSRLYLNELAKRVIDLGYEIRATFEKGKIKGWELGHVTDADCKVQSTRRAQIEEEIEAYVKTFGREPTVPETHKMAVGTRKSELAHTSKGEVLAGQHAKFNEEIPDALYRFDQAKAIANSVHPIGLVEFAGHHEKQTREALESAVRHHSYTEAVFDEKALLTRAMREYPGQIDFENGRMMLASGLGGQVVRLPDRHQMDDPLAPADHAKLTTVDNLRLELDSVAIVKSQMGAHEPLATEYQLDSGLSPDQKAAVEGILDCRDGVMCLRGPAGTGKTTTLSQLDRIVGAVTNASSCEAIYVAPTHTAKGVLRSDGFEKATTVARLQVDLKSGAQDLSGKLLVVDEAGMQSTRDGHDLLAAATAAGARVLYAGDQKQLSSVEAGDFLEIMQRHSQMKTVELSEIHRQREPGYRAAMALMAQGKVKNSLELLDDQGRVKEGGPDYLKNAADEYHRKSKDNGLEGKPASVALVAPTWREVDKLNDLVRNKLKEAGEIAGPAMRKAVVDEIGLSPEERRSGRHYEKGMVISPTVKPIAGLEPGKWYTIQAMKKGTLTLENGRSLRLGDIGDRIQLGRRKELELLMGDKILLQGNDKKSGLTNGTLGVVAGFVGSDVRFRPIVNGKVSDQVRTIPNSYETLTHGFATTVHASQGQTVRDVIGVSGRKLSGQLWNVMTSRGRRAVSIHVPDKAAVIGAIGNTIENRPAALDFLTGTESAAQKDRQAGRSSLSTPERSQTPGSVCLPDFKKWDGPMSLPELKKKEDLQFKQHSRTASLVIASGTNSRLNSSVRRVLQAYLSTAASRGAPIPPRLRLSTGLGRLRNNTPLGIAQQRPGHKSLDDNYSTKARVGYSLERSR